MASHEYVMVAEGQLTMSRAKQAKIGCLKIDLREKTNRNMF